MLRSLRNTIAALGMGLFMVLVPMVATPALATVSADATITDCLSQGTGLTTGANAGAACQPAANADNATTKVNNIITTVINIFSLVVGIVAVIMIVVGGFKYITSGGESSNITSAKNTIVYAIIGLVVVALAQIIVQFVLNKVNAA